MKLFITTAFVLCICFCTHAQQNTFEKVIDTLGSGNALCIQETFDGGYIYCGTSMYNGNDVIVVKLDSMGTIEWAKTYSGPGTERGTYIEQTPDSGYILNAAYDVGLYTKNWLLRLDQFGDTLWTKTFSVGTGATNVDYGNSLANANNILYGFAGYFQPFPLTNLTAYFIATLSTGTFLTSKIYDTSPFQTGAYAIDKTFDNGFIISAWYATSMSTQDFYLIRTDSFGDTLWTKTYDNSQVDSGWDIVHTVDSGFFIAGVTWNNITFKFNVYLIKTDSIGDTLWTKFYNSNIEQTANSAEQTSDGGYIIVGRIVDPDGDVHIIKTDDYGDTLWTRQFGGTSVDNSYFVRQTKDGGYIICGLTTSFGNGGTYIIKTDSLGNVLTGLNSAEINNPFDFTVFPNPNSGIFTVKIKGLPFGKSHIEVYNLNNQCVYTCSVANRATERIDLSAMAGGMYVIVLRMQEKVITKKIIVR